MPQAAFLRMAQRGRIFHIVAVAVFVTATLLMAFRGHPAGSGDPGRLLDAYLMPQTPLMWTLMIAVITMVILDCAASWFERQPAELAVQGQDGRISAPLSAGMAVAAVAIMMREVSLGWCAIGLAVGTILVLRATRQAAGHRRPAVGFLAGWLSALAMAGGAGVTGAVLTLPIVAIAALAILPTAALGAGAQLWIGAGFAYSAAMIWAFCALAIASMAQDPIIAILATLGIAVMVTSLIRAAS
ncbi:MAG: hypothetical protein P3W94_005800 [Paracoccus sp. (in: a-proteobacteria)]|nr:hypothetical protein [Paracoccus sp. (in: a-proteobacteria)]